MRRPEVSALLDGDGSVTDGDSARRLAEEQTQAVGSVPS